jgi:anthranilate synthase/aminodeoxychorismate synthase-like glutamine amidotransferase
MIIVIDNYDSFTYNLVDYLGQLTEEKIEVYRNDVISVTKIESKNPAAIVISPGPKTPTEAGISKEVIQKLGPKLPILGVCLGHQSIGEIYGAKVIHAKHLMHGKTSEIKYEDHPLFKGLPNPFTATRYHSLVLDADTIDTTQLKVLAHAKDDGEIMAIAHCHYPIYGVQFHPESICSPEGLQLLENFLKL